MKLIPNFVRKAATYVKSLFQPKPLTILELAREMIDNPEFIGKMYVYKWEWFRFRMTQKNITAYTNHVLAVRDHIDHHRPLDYWIVQHDVILNEFLKCRGNRISNKAFADTISAIHNTIQMHNSRKREGYEINRNGELLLSEMKDFILTFHKLFTESDEYETRPNQRLGERYIRGYSRLIGRTSKAPPREGARVQPTPHYKSY